MKARLVVSISLAATIRALAASPLDAENIASLQQLAVDEDITWVGGDGALPLEKRGRSRADPCTPGRGQCNSGLGCYGCQGHSPVCQRGPGSNECCFRDDRGPVCQINSRK
ncbi:hypothetical protein CPLU01_11467 [Colletotrichum plurivorum]|uniref:Uncharacterized protein n=1 Tax=Colletotrichum plurivorum TaxID=2175906 RepID=A0A8H6K237_9PEZI|nr:hypothetical protein CPLU01_11467 [Colletotrichum plurivorum]